MDDFVLTKKDVGKNFVCWDGTVTKIVKFDEHDRDGTPFLDSEGFWHDPEERCGQLSANGTRTTSWSRSITMDGPTE